MNNKILIGILINIIVISLVLCTLIIPMYIESTDDSNITLIKEKTHGYAFVNNGSDPYYNYYVDGVLLNLPNNIEGYNLKTIFYDSNSIILHEDNGNIKGALFYAKKSEPHLIGHWQTQDPKNVSYVEIIIENPKGEIIYNQTVKFDMDNFDYSKLNHRK